MKSTLLGFGLGLGFVLFASCSLGCSSPPVDELLPDASSPDTGTTMKDATVDAPKMETGSDATVNETGSDASSDASSDSSTSDASDAGVMDSGITSDSGSNTLANGLVGLWNLDETMAGTAPGNTDFADHSGSGGHGTAHGSITYNVAGNIGKSITLDGTTAYATIPDSNALRPASFTVSVWFKLSKLPGNTGVTVASKPQKAAPWTSPYLSWMIRVNSATFIEASVGSANTYCGGWNTNKNLVAGTWYNVVLTYDGMKATAYLDNTSIGSCNLNAAIGYAAYPILLGADYGSSPVADYFPGTIDQTAIWSRVLNSSELAQLYGGGAGQLLP